MDNANSNLSDEGIADILTRVKSIALIGASAKSERASYKVMAFLLEKGYRVFPVNPMLAGERLMGCEVYASLHDIPHKVDMVEVFRDSKYLYDIVREAHEANIQYVWGQLGVMDAQAQQFAVDNGMTMVVDRCPAIEIPRLGLLQ